VGDIVTDLLLSIVLGNYSRSEAESNIECIYIVQYG